MESFRFRRRPVPSPHASKPGTVAVCLHVFFEDVGHEIVDRLARLETNYALFVTYIDRMEPRLARQLGSLDRDVHFIPTENRGRDVLPFLQCLLHPQIRPFEHIVKLHTKRGESAIGDMWRRVCLDSVVGDTKRFESTHEQFQRDASLTMAGPALTYLSARKFMYGNDANVAKITDSLLGGYWLDDWGFFAGTMFWARRQIFDPFLKFADVGMEFNAERGSADGELEHAFERCFGLLPSFSRSKIALLHEHDVEVLAGVGRPSKEAISKTMAEIAKSGGLTTA
jgi:lipopolysaccharide biosynthesis protein